MGCLILTIPFSHPSTKVVRVRHDNSTSNLKKHAEKCAPPKNGNTIEDHIPGAKYSKALMRYKLLIWISQRYRPYAIVEDPELREIFQMLYSRVEVPSARTISRDMQEVFELSKLNVVALLKVSIRLSVISNTYTVNRHTRGIFT